MTNDRIIAELTRLRTKARRLLAFCGLCSVLAGGLATGLALIVVDWVLWLPPGVRLAAALGLVVALGAGALRWVLEPLRQRMPLDDIALRVERHFCLPPDVLRSAADFAQGCGTGAVALTRHLLDHVEETLRGLAVGTLITRRPLLRRAACLAGLLGLLGLLLIGRPAWLETGVARLTDPFGPTEWPRAVAIEMMNGDATVAVGDPLEMRIRVTRGDRPALRPLLHLRESGGVGATFSMQAVETGVYACTIPAIVSDLTCWAEAGDATTVARPVHVRAVPRPGVIQARARIRPPAYVPANWEREYDLVAGPAKAVPGSEITVCFRFSKPVGRDGAGEPKAALVFPGDERLPLVPSPEDAETFCAIFESADDFVFRVHVEDREGFVNRGGRDYSVRGTADRPPAVVVERPQSLVEVTPDGTVPVAIRAEDDFGLAGLWLSARVNDEDAIRRIELSDVADVEYAADRVRARATLDWTMGSLGVRAGDSVVFRAAALDNRRLREADPQTGESSALRLRIISHDTFRQRLRDEFQLLEGRVRQALGEQEALRDSVRSSGEQTDEEEATRILRAAAAKQDRLADRVAGLADRLQRLPDEMNRNRFDDAAPRQRAEQADAQLQSTAAGPMKDAASVLGRAARVPLPNDHADLLSAAIDRQEQAATALRGALDVLGQWGDYEAIVDRTRQLLDRQQTVRGQTADVGRDTLGQPVDALPPERRLALRRVSRDQDQLAEDLDQLLAGMRRLSTSVSGNAENGASQRSALDSAARRAADNQVPDRMRQAARAAGENRTAAAGVEQEGAETGLTAMLDALLHRNGSRTAGPPEGLTQLARNLQELIRSQQQLLDATEEADRSGGDATACNRLADLQAALVDEARRLATACDTAAALDASVGNRVSDAGSAMQRAEADLRSNRASDAVDAQREALERLERALTSAQRLAEQMRAEAAARSVLALRAALEDLRGQQQTIAAGAMELARSAADADRLGRAGARKAGRLALAQEEAREQGASILEQMGPAVTFRWLMTRILAEMTLSRDRFQQRQIDEALTAGQEQILADLGRLIDAFEQLAALPPPEQAGAPGGTGGEPGAPPSPGGGVPAAAELLLVRALQLDLNARTQRAAKQLKETPPSESQLRQVHDLGRQQQELQALMVSLVRQAQGGGD